MASRRTVTRRSFLAATAATGVVGMRPVRAQAPTLEWKMVTSWPANSPGPGATAQRLADRIEAMSDGRLRIRVYAAGELVSALEVLDAVSRGAAEMGHSAAFFWQGKLPASVFFTAVPFGLTASEHTAWIDHGGGQQLWDELYSIYRVKPLMAGNTGMSMGGWFRKEIRSLDDLKGLKYRIPGLGGEILRRLGGVPVAVAPGDIFTALQSGVVDGAEFLGPWSDRAFGFYKVAPYYYWPGYHEPNGSSECLIGAESWRALPADLQQIVLSACAAEDSWSRAETQWQNAVTLRALESEPGIRVTPFPPQILEAARTTAAEVLAEFADRDAISRKILASYQRARGLAVDWARVSTQAFLNARAPAG